MRKTGITLALAFALSGFAAPAWAEHHENSITVTGEIKCAMCTLKKADATECQNVLVVEGEPAAEYYLVKNDVVEAYGHVCKGAKPATVTGTVQEKEGKMWLTAQEMKPPAAES